MTNKKKLAAMAATALAMVMATAGPATAQEIDLDDLDLLDDGVVLVSDDLDGVDLDGLDLDDGISQSVGDQESESGDVELSYGVSKDGDSSNQSTSALQFGTTGNLQNTQGVVQVGSDADDIEFEGGSFEFSPENSQESDQSVEQAASVSS